VAPRKTNSGAWIIAGAIVLVGLLIIIALVVVLGSTGREQESASPSPSIEGPTPAKTHSPRPHPTHIPSPTESPAPHKSPSPSPTASDATLVQAAAETQANRDRPGQVQQVGQVDFYKDTAGCPVTGQAAAVSVRFSAQPKSGVYMFCKARAHWKYMDGPIYGE